MQFNIEVISVSSPVELPNSRGGKYKKVEVAYKRLDRDGKIEGKPIFDFANNNMFKTVLALKVGDVKQITSEKDDNGYWQWRAVETPVSDPSSPGGQPSTSTASKPADTSAPRTSSPAKAGVGKVTGSNYETKEERAARQVLIVRQSSISSAIAYFAAKQPKGSTATAEDVIAIAAKFEAAVFGQANLLPTNAFDDMEDDIPQ